MNTYLHRTKRMREEIAKKETIIDLLYKANLDLAFKVQSLQHELDVLHQRKCED